MVNLTARILQLAFICDLNDCIIALNISACFLNKHDNTYDEYAREFITCLNIRNLNKSL